MAAVKVGNLRGKPGTDGKAPDQPLVAFRAGGGVMVQDQGAPVGVASTLDFEGAGVSTAVVGGRTVVTVDGGGSNVPDPSGAPDGQVPTVASGDYVLDTPTPTMAVTAAFRDVGSTTTDTSTTVTLLGVAGIVPGWLVAGPGIPPGATVVSVSDPDIEISAAATASGTVTLWLTEPEPASLGPGSFWLRTAGGNVRALSVRDAGDSAWQALGPDYFDANGALTATLSYTASGPAVNLQLLDGETGLLYGDVGINVGAHAAFMEWYDPLVLGRLLASVTVGRDASQLIQNDANGDFAAAVQMDAGGSVIVEAHTGLSLYSDTAATAISAATGLNLNPVIINAPNLPTSDPAAAGQLWNDTGTVKVSAG